VKGAMARIMQTFTPKDGDLDIDGQQLNIHAKAPIIGG